MTDTDSDIQILLASRLIAKNERVFVGVGLPIFAALFAKSKIKPSIVLDVESGALDLKPGGKIGTIGDAEITRNCSTLISTADFFNFWANRIRYDTTILRALEIDQYGNINTFKLSDGRVFGGIGGSIIAAQNSSSIIVLTSLHKDSLVHHVHHITNPVGSLEKDKNIFVVTGNSIFSRASSTGEFQCIATCDASLSPTKIFQGWPQHPLTGVETVKFTMNEIKLLNQAKSSFCK